MAIQIEQFRERLNTQAGGAPSLQSAPQVSTGLGAALWRVAGNQLSNVVGVIGDAVKSHQANQAKAEQQHALMTGMKDESALNEWLQAEIEKAPEDGAGFMDRVNDKLFEYRSSALDGFKTEHGRNVMNHVIEDMSKRIRGNAMEFQAKAMADSNHRQRREALKAGEKTVFDDPSQFGRFLGNSVMFIDGLEGMTAGQRRAAADEHATALAWAAGASTAQRDPMRAMSQISNPTEPWAQYLSAEQLNKLHEAAVKRVSDNQVSNASNEILDAYREQSASAGLQLMTALENSPLDPEQKDRVRSNVSTGLNRLHEQRRQEHVRELTEVQTRIATDTAAEDTLRQVDRLYSRGALTPAEAANYVSRIEAGIFKRGEQAAGLRSIQEAMASGIGLDPSNSEHRRALNDTFAAQTTGFRPGAPQWQATAVALAGKTRMLPDQATAWTRQAMRSPNAEAAASAAQFFGAVRAAAPDSASSFDSDTKAFAALVNGMIEAGTNPPDAVAAARYNVFELKPEVREHREKQYSAGGIQSFEHTSDRALASLIDQDFGRWFSRDPAPTSMLSADFNAQAQRYFVRTGDIELARRLAWADLKTVYGETEVNGERQLSAFPIERAGLTPKEVREDIATILREHPQDSGATVDDVLIVPDSLTLRLVGDALSGERVSPSYALVTKTGAEIVSANGLRIRYTLPGGEEFARRIREERERVRSENKTIIDNARKARTLREEDKQFFRDHPQLSPYLHHGF